MRVPYCVDTSGAALFHRTRGTQYISSALAPGHAPALRCLCQNVMPSLQDQYDDAMFDFSTGDYDSAIAKLKDILSHEPDHFEAQLALGMAHYRKGDYATAIAEGHKAEKLRPHE